jgi:hypothetical protein
VAEKYFRSVGGVQNCVLKVNLSSPYFPFNPGLFETKFLNTFKIFGLSHIKVVHVPVINIFLLLLVLWEGYGAYQIFLENLNPPTFSILFSLRTTENLLGIDLMPLPTLSLNLT